MSDIIEQVSTSLDALTQEYETITHNLANVNTAGFQAQVQHIFKNPSGTNDRTSGTNDRNRSRNIFTGQY